MASESRALPARSAHNSSFLARLAFARPNPPGNELNFNGIWLRSGSGPAFAINNQEQLALFLAQLDLIEVDVSCLSRAFN